MNLSNRLHARVSTLLGGASTIRLASRLLLLEILVVGCTLSLPLPKRGVTILSYNVQNLFDDHTDGSEYEEYDPSRSQWSSAPYLRRLEGLSQVIRDSTRGGPDIVAFQEIEHVGVIDDLRDRFLAGLGYRYLRAIPKDESAIVVGVLSRIPIETTRSHTVFLEDGRFVRPMLEVVFRFKDEPIHLFVCHWKSKSGGARETEAYRIAQATALSESVARLLAENPEALIIVAGDLNESHDEYVLVSESYQTALMPVAEVSGIGKGLMVAEIGDVHHDTASPVLYTPWPQAAAPGSYYYRGVWERIDHMLLSSTLLDDGGVSYAGVEIIMLPYMLTGEGTPLEFRQRSGTGFSDHLPLLLSLASTSG